MNYYNKINKSFNRLLESKSFNPVKKLKEDGDDVNLTSIDWYQDLLQRILENIKGDWFDAYLIDNVIYIIESDFEVNLGNDQTENVGLGILAIYEFEDDNVFSHTTKVETIEHIDEIGKKPLSYFIEKNGTTRFTTISEFIEWYDYWYGRKTFMLDHEFEEYFNSLKPELDKFSMDKETINEDDTALLNPQVNFIDKKDRYVLTQNFKEYIVDMLPKSEDINKHFWAFNPDYNDFKINNLKSKLDKEWSIKYNKLDDRDEYLVSKQEGYDFSYGFYIENSLEDYVTSEFVYSIMGDGLEDLEESKENDVDLKPLNVSLIKRGDDYVASEGFKGYLVSILDDDTPGSLEDFRKISQYFLNMDSYIDEDIDFYVDNADKEWVFKLSKDTSKDETDFTYSLWIGNQWIDWVNEDFFKPFVKKEELKESAGDVKLKKFLFAKTPKDDKLFPQQKEFYNNELGGYLFSWEYSYNKLTGENDGEELSHFDAKKSLPLELQQILTYNESSAWGREDYYPNGIRLFISDGPDGKDKELLNKIFKRTQLSMPQPMSMLKEENNDDDAMAELKTIPAIEIKKQLDDGEISYDDLGDSLFTDYAELLPDGLYEIIHITGDNVSQLTPTALNYLKDKILNEFNKFVKDTNGKMIYVMESDDFTFDSGDISSRFLQAAFNEEMMFEYFDYNSSDVTLDYLDSYLDEDNLKELERLGITKELLKDIIDENISEDEYEHVDVVESELRYAAAQAYNSGSEKEAQEAFNEAFKGAMPTGVTYTKDISNRGHFANIIITERFVSYYYKEIIEKWNEYDNIYHVCVDLFLEIFRDDFNMREPRYGFQGFDKDEFNAVFSDTGIPEIEAHIEEDKKEQK
jgi:hypothetical protein